MSPVTAAPDASAFDLDELLRLCEAATPGPWEAENNGGRGSWIKSSKTGKWAALSCGDDDTTSIADAEANANAALIVAARNAIPMLPAYTTRIKAEARREALGEAADAVQRRLQSVSFGTVLCNGLGKGRMTGLADAETVVRALLDKDPTP